VPQIENPQFISVSGPESPASATLAQRLDFAVAFLRRRYLSILACLLLSLPVGALYLFTAPPTYTASAAMMIETRHSPLQESLLGGAPTDSAWIESQIGILKSQNVAAYVVKQLRLAEDPEFTRSEVGLFDKLLARLSWRTSEPKSNAERVEAAIGALSSGLEVRRVGLSYLTRIEVRSHNSEQAVKIANAMIDGYIFEQLNGKYQANRRAGDWLQERLQTLREQAATAERAVVEFKAKNNIVKAGGTLMNETQMGEMSGQLAAARSHASDVQARLERIEAVRRAYQQDQPASAADETVSEAMSNGIITTLRTQYLDLVNREANWSVRYGKNHVAVLNLRNQIRDIRKSIRDELGRIEETHRSEYKIAKKSQDELEKGLAALISQSTETNQAQVALFSLEAAAQSYRKLYDNFLQRHTESVQQQSFPISDARSISPASVIKTGPKTFAAWIITIFAGGMLGVGFGVLREIMDRGFRTREQVQSVLETECLALVPLLKDGRSSKRLFGDQRAIAVQPRRGVNLPISIVHRMGPRSILSASKMLRTVVDSPSSPYADAIRSIKLTLDLRSSKTTSTSKVIGLTSCLPSEGKSTLAAAMAGMIAQGGARVILVDCDLRNPSLSRGLAPDAKVGFLDVMDGSVPLADAVWNDPATNMAFLPTVANPLLPNPTEMLASDAAKSLFVALQAKYDYVIVDLAPLVADVDVRVASRLIASCILVIEWGSTKVDAVQYALRNAPGVRENIVGAVLNKVDLAAMGRYDSHCANYSNYHYTRSGNSRATN
jgi:succinoglycan biosynthesis transport protein ExoP